MNFVELSDIERLEKVLDMTKEKSKNVFFILFPFSIPIAPQPSPNKSQVLWSFTLQTRLKVSPMMNSPFLKLKFLINEKEFEIP